MMRYYFYFLAMILAIIFCSCSSTRVDTNKNYAVVESKKFDFTMYRKGQLDFKIDTLSINNIWYGFTDSLTNYKNRK